MFPVGGNSGSIPGTLHKIFYMAQKRVFKWERLAVLMYGVFLVFMLFGVPVYVSIFFYLASVISGLIFFIKLKP